MAQMAVDPAIRSECAAISRDFSITEADGLHVRDTQTRLKMISRGQIYFVNLSPIHGRKQAGRRPVLVISADAINRQPLVVTVVVGTDAKIVPRDYPTNVRVTTKETGLPRDTVFFCFQIRSL